MNKSLLSSGQVLLLFSLFLFFGCNDHQKLASKEDNMDKVQELPKTKAPSPIKNEKTEESKSEEKQKSVEVQEAGAVDSIKTFDVDNGLKILVEGKKVTVNLNSGEELASNLHIIRKKDENAGCPSEGFTNIVGKGIYFTIEQQNCSGWLFINEFITFKFLENERKVLLHKFGLRYIDRRNPEKTIPEKVYTQKDFGKKYFGEVHIDSLYQYTR
jgi:hypothetical protein